MPDDAERRKQIDAWVAKNKASLPATKVTAPAQAPATAVVRQVAAPNKSLSHVTRREEVVVEPSRYKQDEVHRTLANLNDLLRCWDNLTDRGRREHVEMMARKLEQRLSGALQVEEQA